jgi:hypothetical protein
MSNRRKDDITLSKDDDDPYSKYMDDDDNTIRTPEKESARSRKFRILKEKATMLYGNAINGFIVGGLVGGSFGLIVGTYTAITHRSLLIIPASTIISGLSFGFFLACGSMIRSDDRDGSEMPLHIMRMDKEAKISHISNSPLWYEQFAVKASLRPI